MANYMKKAAKNLFRYFGKAPLVFVIFVMKRYTAPID